MLMTSSNPFEAVGVSWQIERLMAADCGQSMFSETIDFTLELSQEGIWPDSFTELAS